MLRSLIAVVIAVIIGVAAAKFVENAGQAFIGANAEAFSEGGRVSAAYQMLIAAGWFAGAFIAAAAALLIGRRWAPLGILAAGTLFFSACLTQITFSMSWLMWPAAFMLSAAGGVLAMKLLNAQREHPLISRPKEPFSD